MIKKCSVCNIQVGKNSRRLLCQKHREKLWVMNNRKRSNEIKKKYIKTNPTERRQTLNKYKENNRERVNAWAVLQYHVNKGEILKPSKCEDCLQEKDLHAHHPDITMPLYVKWVCASCHKTEHGYQIATNYV